MSRQYFADVLTEPIGAAFATITATTETVLIPVLYTPIQAFEPRAGKIYELLVGGTFTSGGSGTMTITPRIGIGQALISSTSLGISPVQTVVPSVTSAGFLYRCYLIYRSIGLNASSSTAVCNGEWHSNGAIATAASETAITHGTVGAAVTVDTTAYCSLWIGITCSIAPSIVPQWHSWRSLN